jgi:hypothetical protein
MTLNVPQIKYNACRSCRCFLSEVNLKEELLYKETCCCCCSLLLVHHKASPQSFSHCSLPLLDYHHALLKPLRSPPQRALHCQPRSLQARRCSQSFDRSLRHCPDLHWSHQYVVLSNTFVTLINRSRCHSRTLVSFFRLAREDRGNSRSWCTAQLDHRCLHIHHQPN